MPYVFLVFRAVEAGVPGLEELFISGSDPVLLEARPVRRPTLRRMTAARRLEAVALRRQRRALRRYPKDAHLKNKIIAAAFVLHVRIFV